MKQIAIYAKKIFKQDLSVFENLLKGIELLGWLPVLEKELAQHLRTKFHTTSTYPTFENHLDLQTGFVSGEASRTNIYGEVSTDKYLKVII